MSLAYVNGEYLEIESHSENIQNVYSSDDYGKVVEELILEKYSYGQEIAILRQKEAKPEEYTEYYNYCEECKTEAKRLCGIN